MADIMLTSGSNFEGYEIVEYLGFVNGQVALSPSFLRIYPLIWQILLHRKAQHLLTDWLVQVRML